MHSPCFVSSQGSLMYVVSHLSFLSVSDIFHCGLKGAQKDAPKNCSLPRTATEILIRLILHSLTCNEPAILLVLHSVNKLACLSFCYVFSRGKHKHSLM